MIENIPKKFEITRAICSNSERSTIFGNRMRSWRFLKYDKLEFKSEKKIQIRKKILRFRNMQEKLEKNNTYQYFAREHFEQ